MEGLIPLGSIKAQQLGLRRACTMAKARVGDGDEGGWDQRVPFTRL